MSLNQFLGRRLRRGLLTLSAAAALAACGGGTSQVEAFVAERVFAFGDEASVLTSDGRKYSVNTLNASSVRDCSLEPIWVQSVASLYGLVFAECNPNAVAEPKARMAAAAGAMAADLAAQIDAQVALGGVGTKTLATVMMGANDVLSLYAQYPARSADDLVAEAGRRGEVVADQVNRLVGLDVRVLIATVPDQGLTPFALAEKAAHTDTDRAALLSRLSAALNGSMRVKIVNDGRLLGLVLADEMVQAMVKFPGNFGLANAVGAACTTALPDCTTSTLVTGASSSTWLWADTRQMAYGGHLRLGTLALGRATGNPF